MSPPAAAVENRERAWEAFEARRLTLGSMPFKASIEISRNCNFRCTMCPQSWMPEYAEYHPEFNMTPALFERVTREVFPHLEYAHLQGFGESVISPHWGSILDLCEPFIGKLGLVTNLGKKDDAMWRRLVRMGLRIGFSCDGATAETFEAIRRRGSFEMILGNLATIRAAGREAGWRALAFNVTLQRSNVRELPLFVELAARYDAREVIFSSVQKNLPRTAGEAFGTLRKLAVMPAAHAVAHVRRRANEVLRGSAEDPTVYGLPRMELVALKSEAVRLARESGVRVSFTDRFLEELEPGGRAEERGSSEDSARVAVHQRCFKPFSYVVVNYKGEVGLCNHLITDDGWERMGNLLESSLAEIWNSAQYRKARGLLAGGTPAAKGCRWCFAHRLGE